MKTSAPYISVGRAVLPMQAAMSLAEPSIRLMLQSTSMMYAHMCWLAVSMERGRLYVSNEV